jgi:hypothetical protein
MTITQYRSSNSTDYHGGFIAKTKGATIRNIGFENTNITIPQTGGSIETVGAVVGEMDGCTISNVYNTGKISVSGHYTGNVGGLVGSVKWGGVTITNSYNTADVIVESSSKFEWSSGIHAGGIVGNTGQVVLNITNCFNAGDVSAVSEHGVVTVGGITSKIFSNVNITSCYNTGDITATSAYSESRAGGIVGNISFGSITDCYNAGTVSAIAPEWATVGGISAGIGSNGWLCNNYNSGDVTVVAQHYTIGGISGGNNEEADIELTNYWNKDSLQLANGVSVDEKKGHNPAHNRTNATTILIRRIRLQQHMDIH